MCGGDDDMEMEKPDSVAAAVALVIQTTVSCSTLWTNGTMAPSDR